MRVRMLGALLLLGMGLGYELVRLQAAAGGEPRVMLPRSCLRMVKLTPDSYCTGRDLDHLECRRLKVDYLPNCEQFYLQQHEATGVDAAPDEEAERN